MENNSLSNKSKAIALFKWTNRISFSFHSILDFVISSLSFGRNIYNDYQHICRWEV